MMKGPKKTAIAVRNPEGEIVMEEIVSKPRDPKKFNVMKIPIVRGVFAFASSMALGYKCLMRSAEISALEEIAYINGFIDKNQLLYAAEQYGNSPYGKHLRSVYEGRFRY